MLQLPEERLKELGAAITVKETLGQPDLWRKVFGEYAERKTEIDAFLAKLIEKHGFIKLGIHILQYLCHILNRQKSTKS